MRGLTIILTENAPERLRGALMIALTHQALGGRARIFFQFESVALLQPPIIASADPGHIAAGLPPLAALVDDALISGMELILCQTGLHLTNARADQFDPRCTFGGLASILATLGEDRLLAL
ncbi:peroxiredoxin [Aquisediminimonas sediminicola]|uniref:peroxiredoxin n=1 Tax=Alteraquisediminimonas sediminicola TaxID=2676787 RepID=UPI001C8D26AF|nr:peroxiredoxin [Aquisediminimonas sediminicola]